MNKDIKKYFNELGDFEFPKFLYNRHNSLMKSTLDLGNLACSDANKLRAFKERVKRDFKSTWSEYAEVLYEFGVVDRCSCDEDTFCQICGGSRYIPAEVLNADITTESVFAISDNDPEKFEKLKVGLTKALKQVDELYERNRTQI